MTKLLEDMIKTGTVHSEVLSDSSFFNESEVVPTGLPVLDIAFGGTLDGGLTDGLTILAGYSKSFKTMLGLFCMRAYMRKYPDAVAVFYDSEFGSTPDYLETFKIDTSRVVHIPVTHVEELKFDISKKLDKIKSGQRVFFFLDSLGNLASKKEVDDAKDEKAVADMSRAKAIRSLLRVVTPYLTTKHLPFVMINHVSETMEMYGRPNIPGGLAVTYAAKNLFVITKSQVKDGKDLVGWNFTINVEKSIRARERVKLPFTAIYGKGINRYSGLFDIALEGGIIKQEKAGWYSAPGVEKLMRRKELEADTDFWKSLMKSEEFREYVKKQFSLITTTEESEDYDTEE